MTKTADADKIGSKNLKLNADNIKSVLVKNTKIMSRLKVFKAKTIFKQKEAKKLAAEEKALELSKPKKKIDPKKSPVGGRSLLDKLLEASVFYVIGGLANVYGELIKAFKEPLAKIGEVLENFSKGYFAILEKIREFFGGEKSKIEQDMATVDAKSAELQIDKDESDALAEQGLSEYDTAQADLDALNPQEIDDAVGELKDEEEEEGGELEEAEEGGEATEAEVEGGEVEDGSDLGEVESGTEEEAEEGVVEGMQENPDVPKMNKGGESGKAGSGGSNIKDSIPTLLTPGEFVLKRKIAEAIGYDKLNEINALQPPSVAQKKLDDISMLNTKVGNKKDTVIINRTQVINTPTPVQV
tara:strand:- start:92 stop:1159 length:1068 start_codon:yes stop_codon:yes gene_type:complete